MDSLSSAPGFSSTSFQLLQPPRVTQLISVVIWSVIDYWFVIWWLISQQMTEFCPLLSLRDLREKERPNSVPELTKTLSPCPGGRKKVLLNSIGNSITSIWSAFDSFLKHFSLRKSPWIYTKAITWNWCTQRKKNPNPREGHEIAIYVSNTKNFVIARAERTQLSCHEQTSLQGNAAVSCRNSWACICKLLLYKIKDFEYPLDTGFASTYNEQAAARHGFAYQNQRHKERSGHTESNYRNTSNPKKRLNKNSKYKFLQEDN